MTTTEDHTDRPDPTAGDRNEVVLRGRVSGVPERRVLPSGDEVVAVRLVVRRGGADTSVDTVPVVVGPAPAAGRRARSGQCGRRLLAAVERSTSGQRLEVVGELRRRWWQGGGARRSRVEVRATAVQLLADDAQRGG